MFSTNQHVNIPLPLLHITTSDNYKIFIFMLFVSELLQLLQRIVGTFCERDIPPIPKIKFL